MSDPVNGESPEPGAKLQRTPSEEWTKCLSEINYHVEGVEKMMMCIEYS